MAGEGQESQCSVKPRRCPLVVDEGLGVSVLRRSPVPPDPSANGVASDCGEGVRNGRNESGG